jgi:ABC-type polysaccharide/polyol phosphate export permease
MFIVKQIPGFFQFLADVFQSRAVIYELTKQDFRSKYLGSYLGLVWAFVNPSITIAIFWFVFQVGFKTKAIATAEVPFVLWLIAGMIPWFFFGDSVSSAANSILEKSYLVQKVVFRVSILPIIKILSALLIHFFFVGVLCIMFLGYGFTPQWYYVQVIYYLFAMIILIAGLSWITSSLTLFLRDTGQIVGMLLQFGFWLTPIFWSSKTLQGKYQIFIKLNPLYYIIEGYRDSFINRVWFWEHAALTAYFWAITCTIFIVGAFVFKRLRPHFSDVL